MFVNVVFPGLFKLFLLILTLLEYCDLLLLWIMSVISVLFLLCFHARLFVNALWYLLGKG